MTAKPAEKDIYKDKTLKLNLKGLLEKHDLSMREFSKKSGMHYNTVLSLVNDKYERWGRDTLEQICRTLQCKIDDLLIWE